MRRLLLILALLLGTSGAQAAITCSVSSTPLSFGPYNHQDLLPTDSSSTVTIECQQTGLTLLALDQILPYDVALSTGGAASYSPRQLSNGGNDLEYNLYTDLTYTTVWGDNTGGSVSRSGTVLVPGCLILICASGTALETVYGRLPASQIVPAGSYTDSITVTLTY